MNSYTVSLYDEDFAEMDAEVEALFRAGENDRALRAGARALRFRAECGYKPKPFPEPDWSVKVEGLFTDDQPKLKLIAGGRCL